MELNNMFLNCGKNEIISMNEKYVLRYNNNTFPTYFIQTGTSKFKIRAMNKSQCIQNKLL